MSTVTFLRANSKSARDSIKDYAADASPPTEAQLSQDELTLLPPAAPKKRPRGRPPKAKKVLESPKKLRVRLTNEQRSSLVNLYNEGVSPRSPFQVFQHL